MKTWSKSRAVSGFIAHSIGMVLVKTNMKKKINTSNKSRKLLYQSPPPPVPLFLFSNQPVSAMGDMQVSLLYLPHNDKIKIGLHKARNLTHMVDYSNNMGELRIGQVLGVLEKKDNNREEAVKRKRGGRRRRREIEKKKERKKDR